MRKYIYYIPHGTHDSHMNILYNILMTIIQLLSTALDIVVDINKCIRTNELLNDYCLAPNLQ